MSSAERENWGFTQSTLQAQRSADAGINEVWILSIIGTHAEMGGLMYELPAGTLLGTIRNVELAGARIYEKLRTGLKSKGAETSAIGLEQSSPKEAYPQELVNFARHHRNGHLRGLRRAQEKTGTEIIETVLTNYKTKDTGPKNLAYQVAALIESAGNNQELREKLVDSVNRNQAWQDRIPQIKAISGLELPGLRQTEIEKLFPGAIAVETPQPQTSPLTKLYQAWENVIERTTYNRAIQYLTEKKVGGEADDIATEIISAKL